MIRCRLHSDAQPVQRRSLGEAVSPLARAARWRRLRRRLPTRPVSAGSRVSAAITGNTTAIAAAMAAPDSVLTPTVRMPSRAMHTVMPAKSTARRRSRRLTMASSTLRRGASRFARGSG